MKLFFKPSWNGCSHSRKFIQVEDRTCPFSERPERGPGSASRS